VCVCVKYTLFGIDTSYSVNLFRVGDTHTLTRLYIFSSNGSEEIGNGFAWYLIYKDLNGTPLRRQVV